MKYVLRVGMVVLVLLSFGCQSSSYRWVKTDLGLPTDCSYSFQRKGMRINYCLAPEAEAGHYYFEGTARSRGAHSLGTISGGYIELGLFKDGELVKKINLFRQGDDLDKTIFLRREFYCEGDFDQVAFGYNLRYRQ